MNWKGEGIFNELMGNIYIYFKNKDNLENIFCLPMLKYTIEDGEKEGKEKARTLSSSFFKNIRFFLRRRNFLLLRASFEGMKVRASNNSCL